MKHEFVDYHITLGIIGMYVGLGIVFRLSTELWMISFGVMIFISWFLVWNQPIAKLIIIQNEHGVEQ